MPILFIHGAISGKYEEAQIGDVNATVATPVTQNQIFIIVGNVEPLTNLFSFD